MTPSQRHMGRVAALDCILCCDPAETWPRIWTRFNRIVPWDEYERETKSRESVEAYCQVRSAA